MANTYAQVVKNWQKSTNLANLENFVRKVNSLEKNVILLQNSQIDCEAFESLQNNERIVSSMLNYMIEGIDEAVSTPVEYTAHILLTKNNLLQENSALELFIKNEILNDDKKPIFVPIYHEWGHYSLAKYSPGNNVLEFFDSLKGKIKNDKRNLIVEVLTRIIKVSPKIVFQEDTPKQEIHSNDCGIFVYEFINLLSKNIDLKKVKQIEAIKIRKLFLVQIKNLVYNETGGDLSNLNNEWNHENIVKDLNRKEDRVDRISSEVVRIQKKDKLGHIDLGCTENMDMICKKEEIVKNVGSKEDKVDRISSEVVRIQKKDKLGHIDLDCTENLLSEDRIDTVIEKLELEFYKKGDFYGAKIKEEELSCEQIKSLETAPVNLIHILKLQDKLDYLENSVKIDKINLNNMIKHKFELEKHFLNYVQNRNLPSIIRLLNPNKEIAWSILTTIITIRPMIALSLIARAIYPCHSPHRFHYGNRKCFVRFKKIVEEIMPGIEVKDPVTK